MELLIVNRENALDVFTGKKLDEFLKVIEKDALNFVPDTSTEDGKKQIAAKAYGIAKEKVRIDSIGKELVTGWKAKSKLVDNARKKTRDFLDELKVKVRKPLTDIEEEEKRVEEERIRAIELLEAHTEALELNAVFDKEIELKSREAEIEAKERETQEKQDKEDLIIKLRKEAEEKVKVDINIAHLKKEFEDKAKASDLSHRRSVNRSALDSFVSEGFSEEQAKQIIKLVATNKIKHITINY